jgi:hypothetical protein
MATTAEQEVLVTKAVGRDKSDALFQSAVSKAKRSLKKAPGGRRAWIFYQSVFGAYKPQKPVLEIIDALIEAGAPREDVDALAYYFVSYTEAKYASREVEQMSVKDTLTLAITADTDEVKAEAEALSDPDSPAALEKVIEATIRDTKSNESVLAICRRKLAAYSPKPRVTQW